MMGFLRRLLCTLPPIDDRALEEQAKELSERGKDLVRLQDALRGVTEASAEKSRVLKLCSDRPPPIEDHNGREGRESHPG